MIQIDFAFDGLASGRVIPGFPPGYSGVVVPGGEAAFVMAEAATMVIQDIETTGAAFRHHFLEWVQTFSLESSCAHAGWYALIAWAGSVRETVIGSGRWRLNEGEYASMFTKAWQARRELTGNGSLVTLEALCSEAWLENLGIAMPAGVYDGFPKLMSAPFRICTASMRALIEDILFPPFSGTFRDEFVREQLQQLILLMIHDAGDGGPVFDVLRGHDEEMVRDAVRLIDDHLEQHFSIPRIAQMVGMNECRLKRIFQQVMRMGMHEYLIHQRLMRIRDDILNTDIPFKILFERAMYSSHQAFITGFRRQFGCAPGELRRNR